ncbi:hypothetical protein BGX31_009896 [Mortierella sp. GBA43]|nr:hypothetical protein BGX31_009896 [Mortierella sp. GBA43]
MNGAVASFSTDDDNSSTTSHPVRPTRPHQLTKTGSLPAHLGSFLHSTSTLSPSTSSLQAVETGSEKHALNDSGNDRSSHSTAGATTPLPQQPRVKHLERGALYSGYLTKFSSRTFFSRKQWKRRYFILHQTSLHCFKSSDPQHPLLESLKLCADTIICVTDIFSGKRYCLQITTPGEKNWYVLADTASEMSGWLRELKNTVLRFRGGLPLTSRPGTHYSDSSEMSDLSSSSAAMADGAPVPPIPSQYDTFPGRSPSPPARPPHPSQQVDLFQFSTTGNLNLPSRSISPKTMQEQGQDDKEAESRRRDENSSVVSFATSSSGSGQSSTAAATEYASFGTVMEQADALPPEGGEGEYTPFPSLDAESPAPSRHTRGATFPDLSSDSSLSSMATRSSTGSGRRVSIVVDRPETMITLPRRSSQRLMGSPSRPMSPVSSRPMSPNLNRASPRSSLVVSPPPRSIHRPSSVAIRHSTQVTPMQMAALGLRSGSSSIRSLSPTSDQSSEDQASLSRTPSVRRLRESSFIDLALTGSLMERTYRSPSRPTIIAEHARSLSPTPSLSSLSSAPTSPLPEPPRSDSPVRTLKHSLSNGSSRRIPIVPRHHDPDQLVKRRSSKTRCRSKSQELSVVVRDSVTQSIAARASTPSPRLGAINTKSLDAAAAVAQATPPSSPLTAADKHDKHISFLHGNLVLPPPPAGQQPEPPVAFLSNRPMSAHLQHKPSLSSSSLRSVTSPITLAGASYGGPVSKRQSRESSLSARLATLAPIPLGSATTVPSPPKSALPPIPLPDPPASAPPMLPSHPYGQEANKERDEEEEEEEEEGELMMLEIADDEESATTDAANQPGFEMVLEEEEEEQMEPAQSEENKVDVHAQLEQLRLQDKE